MVQACQPGRVAPLGCLSAARKSPKTAKGGAFPPPCGIHPVVLGGGWTFLFSALGPVGSHRWRGTSTERACSSVWLYFYSQGLTWVSRCSQLTGAWRRSSWRAGRKKAPLCKGSWQPIGLTEGLTVGGYNPSEPTCVGPPPFTQGRLWAWKGPKNATFLGLLA